MFLTGYWSRRIGKSVMRAYQSSRRGGSMEVEVLGENIMIRSSAVVVGEGTIAHGAMFVGGSDVS